jgi:hypothetical protein
MHGSLLQPSNALTSQGVQRFLHGGLISNFCERIGGERVGVGMTATKRTVFTMRADAIELGF